MALVADRWILIIIKLTAYSQPFPIKRKAPIWWCFRYRHFNTWQFNLQWCSYLLMSNLCLYYVFAAVFVLHHPEHGHAIILPIISCIIDGTLEYNRNGPPFASFISLFCPTEVWFLIGSIWDFFCYVKF